MARKVNFNINNTMAVTIAKLNQIDEWIGDLDDLASGTRGSYIGGFDVNEIHNAGYANTSVTHATEWLHSQLKLARQSMFGPDSAGSSGAYGFAGGKIQFNRVLVADSGVINFLYLNQLFVPVDSDLDSQSKTILDNDLDSNWYNRSIIPNIGLTIDSGYIKNYSGKYLAIGQWFYTDSDTNPFRDSGQSLANFNNTFNFGLTVNDSAIITVLSGPIRPFPFPRPRRFVGDSGYGFDSNSGINIIGTKKDSISHISILSPDSGDSSTNWKLNYDSAGIVKLHSDSATLTSHDVLLDSDVHGPHVINRFIFDVDSSFDTIPDWRPGFPGPPNTNIDSPLIAVFHDRLDSGFRYTSFLEIRDSNFNISFGGYMLSKYDSDNRL